MKRKNLKRVNRIHRKKPMEYKFHFGKKKIFVLCNGTKAQWHPNPVKQKHYCGHLIAKK